MNWPEQINQVVCADVLDYLSGIPDGVVQTCITSPPYWGLRDYGVLGQLGLESTPEEYVAKMVEIFAEVRRVLRDDGTVWLNISDSSASGKGTCHNPGGGENSIGRERKAAGAYPLNRGNKSTLAAFGLKPKDLCLIPYRMILALQADGWWIRSAIVWAKGLSFCDSYVGSIMPDSAEDRPSSAYEMVYLLSKSRRYYYDYIAVKESSVKGAAGSTFNTGKTAVHQGGKASDAERVESGTRNLRNVWVIQSEKCSHAHFATFPTKLVEPCILAGTSEKGQCPECGKPWVRVVSKPTGGTTGKGWQPHIDDDITGNSGGKVGQKVWDTYSPGSTLGWRPDCECGGDPVPQIVLDPFGGKGTTAKRAKELGRDYLTCDLNEEYCQLARQELSQEELF